MDDGGVIYLVILGLLASLQFITLTIIDPYIKKKKGEQAKYSKPKILLTILFTTCFLVLLILDLLGFLNIKTT